jgi:hypothetical protein
MCHEPFQFAYDVQIQRDSMSATVAATSKRSSLPARMGLLPVSPDPHLWVLSLCISDEPV